jgi:threonine synthase
MALPPGATYPETMTVLYQSTRGTAPDLDMRGVTLTGLATDGGLYVPKKWPQFSASEIDGLKNKSYVDGAAQVLLPFVAPSIGQDDVLGLVQKAYAVFDDAAITPLRQLDDTHWVLELFHGPTLAFKDIAMQLLGHVFEYFLAQSGQRMTVLGATSGDTGSAAMAALAGRLNIDVFILYPVNGPSDIQRKQMTCVAAPNVHAIAIEGSFDDCQAIVKTLFNTPAYRAKYSLAAVNSMNWLRILAQMVYYFIAASHFAPKPVSFVVPTGNFGNVFAGYAAMQCGALISKLAVATNRNDSLSRFFASGQMKTERVHATLSPSMDIQISSNFERLLFDLCGHDSLKLRTYMEHLRKHKEFKVSPMELGAARQIFTATCVNDEMTMQTIREVYQTSGTILDPHSAVGVAAAKVLVRELPEPIIMLGCAHPAKFPETMRRVLNITPGLPEKTKELLQNPERSALVSADAEAVEKFMAGKVAA